MFGNKRIIIILTLLLSSLINALAQEKLSFPIVNSRTYNQYLNEQWKELIKTGKKSKKAGIDFYYLQVRMGIAYYNLKRFRQAIPYLEKALEQSTDNDFVKEYLYYAYLFSGRYQDALKFSGTISEEFRKNAGIKTASGISSVGFNFMLNSFDDYEITALSSDTLIQYNQTAFSYLSISFENIFENKSSLLLNYGRLTSSENIHDLNSSYIPVIGSQDIAQNQIYLRFMANLGKGFNLLLASNILHTKFNVAVEYTDSVSTSGSGSGFGGGSTGTFTNYSTNSVTINEFVGYAALYKDFSLFKIGMSASISNLYDGFQTQPGFSVTFYPLGNTNIYTYSRYDFQIESYNGYKYNTSIFKQALGVGLWGLYIEPSLTFGDISNFIEGDGLIINNARDIIKSRYEVVAYTWLFKGKLKLYLNYQNYKRLNYYSLNNNLNTTTYNYQTITGGVKWNF